MLDPQPWLRAAAGDEPERRLSNNLGDSEALVLAPRAEFEQDHDQYPQPSDLDTVEGCIRVSNRAAEKLGAHISAAYEEMDGLHRSMSSPMGRLLHDGISNLVQIKSMSRFIQRRHDRALATAQDEIAALKAVIAGAHALWTSVRDADDAGYAMYAALGGEDFEPSDVVATHNAGVLLAAAADIQRLHPGEVKASVVFLEERAAAIIAAATPVVTEIPGASA